MVSIEFLWLNSILITLFDNRFIISAKYNRSNVDIILEIIIDIVKCTMEYNFVRTLNKNCRQYTSYSGAVNKHKMRYNGKLSSKEIVSLMNYVK